jgi:hypothetical protein
MAQINVRREREVNFLAAIYGLLLLSAFLLVLALLIRRQPVSDVRSGPGGERLDDVGPRPDPRAPGPGPAPRSGPGD